MAMFTPGQVQFIHRYAQQTGLNPQVVAAEVFNEMNGQAATSREQAGIHNWLNIGYTDVGQRGTDNPIWRDPIKAADASAAWIKGNYSVPGFGHASSGIQGILKSVGQSPTEQIRAIQGSGWASSGYPNLPGIYQQVGGKLPAGSFQELPNAQPGRSVFSNLPNAPLPAAGPPVSVSPLSGLRAPPLPIAPDVSNVLRSSLGEAPSRTSLDTLLQGLLGSNMQANQQNFFRSQEATPTLNLAQIPDAGVSTALPAASAQATVPAAGPPSGTTPKGMQPGLAEAFYDPLGSYDSGSFGGPIGGHSDHVHISDVTPEGMLNAIKIAQGLGLHVGENPYTDSVDPVHVPGSFHYKTFPGLYNGKKLGQAIDVSGPPDVMAAFYNTMTGRS